MSTVARPARRRVATIGTTDQLRRNNLSNVLGLVHRSGPPSNGRDASAARGPVTKSLLARTYPLVYVVVVNKTWSGRESLPHPLPYTEVLDA